MASVVTDRTLEEQSLNWKTAVQDVSRPELRVQEQRHHIEHRTHGAWHVEQCAYRPLLGSEAFPDPTGTITGFLHLPQAV
jgi:hypothetical protein